jgi:deoxyribodipyrimidine photolyase
MQKYLLTESQLKEINHQYTVMTPFIAKAKGMLKPSNGLTDYGFSQTGMGNTGIGLKLYNGADPILYYNSSQTHNSKELRRELLIREFFRQGPLVGGKRPASSWASDKTQAKHLQTWKVGETGYLFVDAGMKQLAEIGWMPNRVRMACASFLTKNMGVHWSEGEAYFADKLIDYNRYSNIGNWLWLSGDAFNTRVSDVMSPDAQFLKFDSKCEYVNSILGTKFKSAREAIASQKPVLEYQSSKEWYLKKVM